MYCTLAAPAAVAETPARVLVVPVTGSLPASFADVPERLTNAVVQLSARDGVEVLVAETTLADTAAIVGCSIGQLGCLEQILAALDVERIVFGTVESDPVSGTLLVAITVAARGRKPDAHNFSLRAVDADQATAAFIRVLAPVFGYTPASNADVKSPAVSAPAGEAATPTKLPPELQADSRPVVDSAPSAAGVEEAGAVDRDATAGFSLDRVGMAPWLVLGGSSIAIITGAIVGIQADLQQGAINGAPVASVSDFEQLLALEDRGQMLANISNALLASGIVAAAIGTVWLVYQGTAADSATAIPVAVTPVASGNQFGVALTVGWSL